MIILYNTIPGKKNTNIIIHLIKKISVIITK